MGRQIVYTGVSVSGLSGYRDPPFHDSLKGQNLSGQFRPRCLGIRTVRIPRPTVNFGIRTPVLSIRTGVRIPRPLKSKSCQKHKINAGFGRSEYGEFKNLCKTSLSSLEAEKKPLYRFWQLFNSKSKSCQKQ